MAFLEKPKMLPFDEDKEVLKNSVFIFGLGQK
jgi:hypothetical protein